MKTLHRTALATIGLLAFATSSQAQMSNDSYLGLSLGKSKHDIDCGSGLYSCDRSDTAAKLTYGRNFLPVLGGEISIFDAGSAARGGGDTDAKGADVFVVGRLPLGPLSAFGKAGATYSRTETNSGALSGLTDGKASGWGPSYGVGLGWDFASNLSLVTEWERRKMHYAGEGKQDVDTTSVGLRYRF